MTAIAAVFSALALASGLHGTVTRGPTRPVCTVGTPCSERVRGTTVTFVRAGRTYRTKTDERGRYRVALAAGRYTVRVAGADFGVRPATVVVIRGVNRAQNLFVDTGIR